MRKWFEEREWTTYLCKCTESVNEVQLWLSVNLKFKLTKSVKTGQEFTASVTHSRSICILWYDLRVLWPAKSTIKSHATPLSFWLLIDISWNFKCWKAQRPSSNGCKIVDAQSWRSKKSRPFGFEAFFFATLRSESLLFGRPGFDPRTLQTLRAYNFAAPWSTRL